MFCLFNSDINVVFPFTVVTFSLHPHSNLKAISWDFLRVAEIAEGPEVYCLAQDNTEDTWAATLCPPDSFLQ